MLWDPGNRVEARPILEVGYKSNFVKVHQGRANQPKLLYKAISIAEVQASGRHDARFPNCSGYGGHAIS